MTTTANELIIRAKPIQRSVTLEDVKRSIVSAQILTQFAVDHGVDRAVCLRDSGITADSLNNPQTEITAAQELQLIRNMLVALGNPPGLGLDAGLRYHLSAYGIWGFALLSSPNMREVSKVVERYLDLSFAFIRFRFEVGDEFVRIVLDDREVPEDVGTFLLERDFAAWANAMSELMPAGVAAERAQFRHLRPSHVARYAELCGVVPTFGASDNAITLDAAVMDAPLAQGNLSLARMCLDQCRQLLDKRKHRVGVAGRVRSHLFRNAGSIPSLETVASQLHLSARSLRRHLLAEGTSFRALSDEVLEALAEELLTTAHLKLEEVAERLGYAEPASFIHAFKRWKGVSPNVFREQHRGNGP